MSDSPEQRASAIMEKYGWPKNAAALHAMLAFAVQQGKVDGSTEAKAALKDTFDGAAINGPGSPSV